MIKTAEKKGYVYLLRNKINGKGYVGQHYGAAAEDRWQCHIYASIGGSEFAVHRAIRKYGVEGFTAEVVWRGPVSRLDAAEIRCIKNLNTFAGVKGGWGYTMTRGGDGVRGLVHREDSKLKMAASANERWSNPVEHEKARVNQNRRWSSEDGPRLRAKASEKTKELFEDPVFHAKFCAAQKRRFEKKEEREAARIRQTGKKDSRVTRMKKASSQNARFEDPVERAKLSAGHLRSYTEDPTIRQRLSKSAKAFYAVPANREHQSRVQTLRCADPEVRRRMSEAGLATAATKSFKEYSEASKRAWVTRKVNQAKRKKGL